MFVLVLPFKLPKYSEGNKIVISTVVTEIHVTAEGEHGTGGGRQEKGKIILNSRTPIRRGREKVIDTSC